jgi:alkanesulfonate monooxygenase SsuD/methylene tetrahydromethanopterin reductase-like flavin-dependent oxidoreductase (luciferase family)
MSVSAAAARRDAGSPGAVPRDALSFGVRARSTAQLKEKLTAASGQSLTGAWLYDSGRCIEAYSALGAAVAEFPGLTLGIAVTNFVTRHIVVLANALATAANLADREIRCVLGRGDSAVKFIGRKPQPISEFESDLRVLKDLLAGRTVTVGAARYTLPEPPARPVVVFVSADGPRMWHLAGRLADGALIGKAAFPGHLERAVAAIRQSATAIGRVPESVPVCAWVHGAAAADRASAVDSLWPEVGRSVLHAIRTGYRTVSDEERRAIAELALRQDAEFELSARLRRLLGDDILDSYTVVGTYKQVHDRLSSLLSIEGVTEVAVNLYPATPESGLHSELGAVLSAG